MSQRRAVTLGTLRAVATVAVMVTLYYILPLRGVHRVTDAAAIILGTAGFGALAFWQIKSILHADYPVLRAVQALTLIISLFLVIFATTYYEMEASNASSFSSTLSRTDALYFCVTVFSTVGFGDIVARTETARVVVMVQMIGDLVIIGALIRMVATVAQHARSQRTQNVSNE